MVNTNIYSTVALMMGDSQTDPAVGKLSAAILPSKIKQNSNESLTFILRIKGLKSKICGFVKQASASFSEFDANFWLQHLLIYVISVKKRIN